MRSGTSWILTNTSFQPSELIKSPYPAHTHTCRKTGMQKRQVLIQSSTHCYSLHVGFPSATHPQREQRISVATPPLAAIQYLQREREGRQESPWGHCPVRGQTNTDQVPQKLSAISTPNLRTEKQAPHTQRQNLKTQEQEERDPKAI